VGTAHTHGRSTSTAAAAKSAPGPRADGPDKAPVSNAARQEQLRGAQIDTPAQPRAGGAAVGASYERLFGAEKSEEGPSTVPRGGGNWTVGPGDSLWSIAKATYGDGRFWEAIRDANPGKVFRGGHLIHDGKVLSLPTLQVPTLQAMEATRGDPAALRDLAVAMSDEDYGAFLAKLSADERLARGDLLGLVELMRSTGKTPEELGADQRAFLEAEAAKAGKTAGELVFDRVDTQGYGGGSSAGWDNLPLTTRRAWDQRFKAVVKRLHSEPPEDVRAIITMAEGRGGGFRWNPAETERNGAFAYTAGDWALHCGTRFVEAAERDLASVYANVAHEMGGHNAYGAELGGQIIDEAIAGMGEGDQAKAQSSKNPVFTAYGYMETEIFAELYEASYDRPDNPTDRPFDTNVRSNGTKADPDVNKQLARIQSAFAPDVAKGIVRSLALRVQLDTFIHVDIKSKFRAQVAAVFGDILPKWSAPSSP
jgi:hypothetical protein